MKKSSDKWQKICKTTVYDPDGWDRKNYQFSWYEERITRKEFENRLIFSTCKSTVPWGKCIWKDFPYFVFFYIRRFIEKLWSQIMTAISRPSVWDNLLPKICVIIAIVTSVLCGAYILLQIIGVSV